jgi:hypothetical protein
MEKLRPREVDVLTYPNRAHMIFGVSSSRVRFLELLIILKIPLESHCNHLLVNERNVTSLLRDNPPIFQQACFRFILQFQLISLLNRKPI